MNLMYVLDTTIIRIHRGTWQVWIFTGGDDPDF